MPRFSDVSKGRLESCTNDLQRLMTEVVKTYDITICCGHRGPREQNAAHREGKSKLKYPESRHNIYPSQAVDIAPYVGGINWDDRESFYMLAGYVRRVAEEMGINLRLGADWNGDNLTRQTLCDPGHFELG